MHAGQPILAERGRWADPRVAENMSVTQGVQVRPVLVDPCVYLIGSADGPVAGDEDYLAALRLIEGAAGDVDVLVPGHGSIGGAGQVRARIDRDRAYVRALRDAGVPGDPRVGPSATFDWMSGVHERQLQQLARRRERDGTPVRRFGLGVTDE